MSILYAPIVPFEYEVAQRWWTIPVGSRLPLVDGSCWRLIFPGTPGGSSGPDVRDAVLSMSGSEQLGVGQDSDPHDLNQSSEQPDIGRRLVGDVEFHVQASDWWQHHHESDPRYNHVILHVVLNYNDTRPVLRQDGQQVPVCSLNDLSLLKLWPGDSSAEPHWPCQRASCHRLSSDDLARLLQHAGLLRFEEKTQAFVVQLRNLPLADGYHPYDYVLVPALAEGLAYGRDRALFRALGQRLLAQPTPLPNPLSQSEQPSRSMPPVCASWLVSLPIGRRPDPGSHCAVFLSLPTDQTLRSRLSWQRYGPSSAILVLESCTQAISFSVMWYLPFAAAVGLIEQDEHATMSVRTGCLSGPSWPFEQPCNPSDVCPVADHAHAAR